MEGKWTCAKCETVNENSDTCFICGMTYEESAAIFKAAANKPPVSVSEHTDSVAQASGGTAKPKHDRGGLSPAKSLGPHKGSSSSSTTSKPPASYTPPSPPATQSNTPKTVTRIVVIGISILIVAVLVVLKATGVY